jgi:hypothetical protein
VPVLLFATGTVSYSAHVAVCWGSRRDLILEDIRVSRPVIVHDGFQVIPKKKYPRFVKSGERGGHFTGPL